jgi:tRNA G10  N-methylase Trm11
MLPPLSLSLQKNDLWVNFKHYGLPKPDIVCGCNSQPVFTREAVFDAMVCDPPYGVRAGNDARLCV